MKKVINDEIASRHLCRPTPELAMTVSKNEIASPKESLGRAIAQGLGWSSQ
jgi:hypothetical protein